MAGIGFKQDYLRHAVYDVHDQRCAGINGLNVTKWDIDGDRIDMQIGSPYLWTRKPEIIFHGTQPARRCKVSMNGSPLPTFSGAELELGISTAMPIHSPRQDAAKSSDSLTN
jgi:hypothetical protein